MEQPNPTVAQSSEVRLSIPRLMSVDALRGFDMFWIMQGKEVVIALITLLYGALPPWLQYHFEHPEWIGFSAWDLIMPLFLFISGVTIPFSIEKYTQQQSSRKRFYIRLIRRIVILWILGMIAQGHLLSLDLNKIHLFSNTLQAIAVGYLFSSIVWLYIPIPYHIPLTIGLLVIYWLWMMFVPLPGVGIGILEPERNWAMYIDEWILGRFRDGTHYTWILSSLGFSATVMLGAQAGYLIRSIHSRWKTFFALVGAGLICLVAGWLWSFHFPWIKHVWSSSMTLWAGGWSFLLLAIFYLVMEIFGFTSWAFPFTVIGCNAIIAYMGAPFLKEALLFFGGNKLPQPLQIYLIPITVLVVMWLILYALYRKKWFLRV